MLRNTATKPISVLPATESVRRPTMRHLETLTGGLFAVATIVLAVEAIIAF